MATQKPISTISYNTKGFLEKVLKDLYDAHIMQNYTYIWHKGEDGDKDHFHVRLEPNKRIDPMEIRELFKEPDPDHEKPLGCRPFRPSVEEDWVLYVVHDPDYLKLKYGGFEKGEKIPYNWIDIKAPEDYDVEVSYIRAKQKMRHSGASIAKHIREGKTSQELIELGENPFLVNAIAQSTRKFDYDRLFGQYKELQGRYMLLEYAINQYNLKIIWDEDKKCHLEIND